MASEIRFAPVLTGETAEQFVAAAERVEREGHKLSFTEEFVRAAEHLSECSRQFETEHRGQKLVFE